MGILERIGGSSGAAGGASNNSVTIGDISVSGSSVSSWFDDIPALPIIGLDSEYSDGYSVGGKFIGIRTDNTSQSTVSLKTVLRSANGSEDDQNSSVFQEMFWGYSGSWNMWFAQTPTTAENNYKAYYVPSSNTVEVYLNKPYMQGIKKVINLTLGTITAEVGVKDENQRTVERYPLPDEGADMISIDNFTNDYETLDGLLLCELDVRGITFAPAGKGKMGPLIMEALAENVTGFPVIAKVDPSNAELVLLTGYKDTTKSENVRASSGTYSIRTMQTKLSPRHKLVSRTVLDNYLKALYIISGGVF